MKKPLWCCSFLCAPVKRPQIKYADQLHHSSLNIFAQRLSYLVKDCNASMFPKYLLFRALLHARVARLCESTRNWTKLKREKVFWEEDTKVGNVEGLRRPLKACREQRAALGLSTEPLCLALPLAQNRGWCYLGNGVKSVFLCPAAVRETTFCFLSKIKTSKAPREQNQIETIPLWRRIICH